jgi:hypothetical protein
MLGTTLGHSNTISLLTLIKQTSLTPLCKLHPFPPSRNQSRQSHQVEPQKPRPGSLLLVCLVEAGIVGVMPSIRLARSVVTPIEPASMRSPDEIAPSLHEATSTSSRFASRVTLCREEKKREECNLLQLSDFETILSLIMNHIQCPVSADRAPAFHRHRLDRKATRRC